LIFNNFFAKLFFFSRPFQFTAATVQVITPVQIDYRVSGEDKDCKKKKKK
jgi:hypothetical protein